MTERAFVKMEPQSAADKMAEAMREIVDLCGTLADSIVALFDAVLEAWQKIAARLRIERQRLLDYFASLTPSKPEPPRPWLAQRRSRPSVSVAPIPCYTRQEHRVQHRR